jgi:hypothetical protein
LPDVGIAVAFVDHVGPVDLDVWIQKLNSSLAPVGGPIPIDFSTAITFDPTITSVSNGGLFVTYTYVVSATDWQIVGNTVSSTGVVGPPSYHF